MTITADAFFAQIAMAEWGTAKKLAVAPSAVRILPSHNVGGLAGDLSANARALARKHRNLPLVNVLLSDRFPDWTSAFCTFDLECECWILFHWFLRAWIRAGASRRGIWWVRRAETHERSTGCFMPAYAARTGGIAAKWNRPFARVSLDATFPSQGQEPRNRRVRRRFERVRSTTC